MSNRTVYEVAPRGGDSNREWTVKRRGVERPLHVEKTKAEAVAMGVALGRANMPPQLFIKLANGKIEEERTYGDDPFPPAG
jgi:hypothetical protein